MAGKFGWHSGDLKCQNINVLGDLTINDDIIFSDVSAGRLGITGGIDMQSTTSAIGIDMGGTYSTAAINIDGTQPIGINIAMTDAVGGYEAILVTNTFTKVGAAAHKAISVALTYTPATAGTACPIGVASKVILNGDLTRANNYQGYGWGVQGQIDITDGTTIADNGDYDPGAVYAALRGVVTGTGTGNTFTDGTITSLYAENQLKQDASSGTFRVFLAWLRFQGTTASVCNVDAGLYIDSGNAWENNITVGIDINDSVTGIDIGACTTGISMGNATTGIDFTGTYLGNCIDFSDATINYTGTSGPAFIRAGTYTSPVTNADEDQSGMLRLYGQTSANGTSNDKGVFQCLKTTGTKNIMPICGLAEILAQSGAGPTLVHGAEFVVHMNSATAALGVSTTNWCGMAGVWAKVTSNVGSATNASSRIAPIWLDSKMNGTVNGKSHMAWITPTPKVDSIFGFNSETSTATADYLFEWDSSCYDELPIASGGTVGTHGTATVKIAIRLSDTTYYLLASTVPTFT